MDRINELKISKTRFSGLGYARIGKEWSFVDLSGDAPIGPRYPTKLELLADAPRFAAEFFGTEA